MTLKAQHLQLVIKKATQSPCNHRVSAIGFDKAGNLLGTSSNRKRFSRWHGGEHAEARLIRRYRSHLKTIVICRINKSGNLLPIHPCEACKSLANKFGIQIKTLTF